MGEYVIKKWQCDRCGVVLDKRPYHDGGTYYSVKVQVDYVTAGGGVISWKEMCGRCNREVEHALEDLKTPSHSITPECCK